MRRASTVFKKREALMVMKEKKSLQQLQAISERTKKSTAPLLAAGRYPSLTVSISLAVASANFSFSNTWRTNEGEGVSHI